MSMKAVNNYPSTIKYVLDRYKTQEMCITAANTCSVVFDSVSDARPTKCVIKLLIITLLQQNMFLIDIRLNKCVIKLLIIILLHWNLFRINIELTKFVPELFLMISFN